MTTGEYLERWLADTIAPTRRPGTLRAHTYALGHAIRIVGPIPLADLSPLDVQRMIGELSQTDLSASTVRQVLRVLRAALNQAVRWGMLAESPARHVSPPRPGPRAAIALSPAEVRRYVDAAGRERLHALYTIAVLVGLRRGELMGLTWACVDLAAGTVRIEAQLARDGGRLVLCEPKTDSSRRTVYLPAEALDRLALWRGERETEELRVGSRRWRESGLVFCARDGGPTSEPGIHYGHKRILRRAGLPDCRLHDLRHSACSAMLAAGVQPHVVMAIMGHSNVTQTLAVYSHAGAGDMAAAARAVQGLVGPGAGGLHGRA